MKTLTKVDSWLPIFSGFYGTIWETDNEEMELTDINEHRKAKNLPEVTWDDVEWAYNDYYQTVAEGFTNWIGDYLNNNGFIHGYEYQKINSPREYNFVNDSINVSFTLSSDNRAKIANYLMAHSEKFAAYLKSHYTSYAGFCPNYSNEYADWMDELDKALEHKHQLGAVLEFIVRNEEGQDVEMKVYEDLTGNEARLYATNYEALVK